MLKRCGKLIGLPGNPTGARCKRRDNVAENLQIDVVADPYASASWIWVYSTTDAPS